MSKKRPLKVWYRAREITRVLREEAKQAKAQGLKQFHATLACPYCTGTLRYVSSRACVPCAKERVRLARIVDALTAPPRNPDA